MHWTTLGSGSVEPSSAAVETAPERSMTRLDRDRVPPSAGLGGEPSLVTYGSVPMFARTERWITSGEGDRSCSARLRGRSPAMTTMMTTTQAGRRQ